ncbi:Magnesium transporter MgtE [Novipirellula galeiformis]|uniref:Magnesium transporter MgtE n=1 Tax=Novipirellula galeiformis TaxID=2528004 RepID=A0A5C6CNV5_9BACT|nr:magnesium transporter [Novipirellula galeiformis]TWU25061.1 Magnesium transporter MgtE [Novipirellula galeiformis]
MPSSDAPTSNVAIAEDRPWEELLRLAQEGTSVELEDYVSQLSTADQCLALSRLDEAEETQVLEALKAEDAAELISHLPEVEAARMLGLLDTSTAAAIVQEMPSDEQADVLGDLSDAQAEAILDELPREEAAAVRELSSYDDDEAGGMMVREMLRFSDQMSVRDVIQDLSDHGEDYSDFDVRYAYVCDSDDRLVGVLPMQNLLFVKRAERLADLMIVNPISVQAKASLDDLVELFDAHNYLAVPVVDEEGKLQGIVHREAVDYEETRAIESDYLKSQGIVGGEELRTMPLWLRAKRRLSWLSINVFLNIGAAAVIAYFQDTLQAVIALAVFLPIISDMSGCSGNQAVAVSMRELSLGLVRPTEMLRVWWQEVSVGLINGAALGLLVAILAVLFNGNPYLGIVVGIALFTNTIIAVSIGGVVPLLLKRFGFDPAVASGPLLTTVTDMCGFFLVLGLATMMLSKLI